MIMIDSYEIQDNYLISKYSTYILETFNIEGCGNGRFIQKLDTFV